MSEAHPQEITFELSGNGTVRLEGLTIHIKVEPPAISVPAALPAPAGQPALAAAPAAPAVGADDEWDELDLAAPPDDAATPPGVPEDQEYYRDLSHDMFREVGRLARRLSMSIRDVKVPKVDAMDIEAAGDQLEQAKDQLENVVKMTEQATLKIMYLGENIQKAIDKARGIMERLDTAGEEAVPAVVGEEAAAARRELQELLAKLTAYLGQVNRGPLTPIIAEAEALRGELASAAVPAAAPAPPPPVPEPAAPRNELPRGQYIQTTYELCTNETVKKHIKAMWDAGAQEFRAAPLAEALNQLAPETPDADNFLNLPLKEVLKALFGATDNDRFKQVLKKMASTVDQIFLEQSLPIEAMPAQAAVPAAAPAAPAAPAGPDPKLVLRLEALVASLKEAAAALAPPALPLDLTALLERAVAGGGVVANQVEPQMRNELEKTMSEVFTYVNSIIEALAFQDLSGQTIYKIVRLLTEFQVQLLAMVVSFGSKLKTKETDQRITTDQSEKLAQEEVDKVMSTLGVAADAAEETGPGKLDQLGGNDRRANLGFGPPRGRAWRGGQPSGAGGREPRGSAAGARRAASFPPAPGGWPRQGNRWPSWTGRPLTNWPGWPWTRESASSPITTAC